MSLHHILALFFLLFPFSTYSQKGRIDSIVVNSSKSVVIYNDAIGKQVQEIIDEEALRVLEDSLINSLSIGIYINNVSFTNHYGELKSGLKADNSTFYEIASISKTFTGSLAAKAVLEKRMALDDDIRKFLPRRFKLLELDGEGILVRHLLTHTSGLYGMNQALDSLRENLNEIDFARAYYKNEIRKTKEGFFAHLESIEPITRPGSQFNYSNFASNLMAYVLECIYDRPFQDLVNEMITGEMGLKETYFKLPIGDQRKLAPGYKLGLRMPELPLSSTLWGAEGALKSTLPDILKYIDYQLSKSKIVEESHRKLYEIDTDYWIAYYWWIISNNNYDLHFRHDGGGLRSKTVLLIFPKANFGVSILTNESSILVNDKLSELAHVLYQRLGK